MFKEGDRVRLSEIGRRVFKDTPFNPHKLFGTVEGISGPRWAIPYYVRWPSGLENTYNEVHLEHSDLPDLPLEQLLKECLG